jgi:hypothetical protein
MKAFHATGLTSGLLLGARASTRLVAAKRTRSASCHRIGTFCSSPSTVSPTAR